MTGRPRCLFDAQAVLALLDAADAAGAPAILFVIDHGIYLMGEGMGGGTGPIVYAAGANPATDHDVDETTRMLAGDDDDVVRFDAADLRAGICEDRATDVWFQVADGQVLWGTIRRVRPVVASTSTSA